MSDFIVERDCVRVSDAMIRRLWFLHKDRTCAVVTVYAVVGQPSLLVGQYLQVSKRLQQFAWLEQECRFIVP